MTVALTRAVFKGIEVEEALTKKYIQHAFLTVTAANTDIDIDLGDFTAGALGAFWTAVSGSDPGDDAILAAREVQAKAESFIGVASTELADYLRAGASSIFASGEHTTAGGAAFENITVANALATDVVLVTIHTVGSTPVTLLTSLAIAGAITITFSADPSTDHVVSYVVIRPTATTVAPGQYSQSQDGTETHWPNLVYATTDAPTSTVYVLSWVLTEGQEPVELVKTA